MGARPARDATEGARVAREPRQRDGWSYNKSRKLRELLARHRMRHLTGTSPPNPICHARTARSSASTKRCRANGLRARLPLTPRTRRRPVTLLNRYNTARPPHLEGAADSSSRSVAHTRRARMSSTQRRSIPSNHDIGSPMRQSSVSDSEALARMCRLSRPQRLSVTKSVCGVRVHARDETFTVHEWIRCDHVVLVISARHPPPRQHPEAHSQPLAHHHGTCELSPD